MRAQCPLTEQLVEEARDGVPVLAGVLPSGGHQVARRGDGVDLVDRLQNQVEDALRASGTYVRIRTSTILSIVSRTKLKMPCVKVALMYASE